MQAFESHLPWKGGRYGGQGTILSRRLVVARAPYRARTEVQAQNHLRPIPGFAGRDVPTALQAKRSRDNRGALEPDRMHMPTGIPLKLAVSSFVGFLKGKSALMMRCLNADSKRELGNRHFWVEGCVSNVGLNEAIIAKRIREQEAPRHRAGRAWRQGARGSFREGATFGNFLQGWLGNAQAASNGCDESKAMWLE